MNLEFSIPGPPVPWSRTYTGDDGKRHNNKRLVTYKKHIRVVAHTELHLWSIRHPGELWPTDALYRLYIDVHTKSDRRGDASNYLKGIEDACEGVLYDNDRQLAVVASRVFVGQEKAYVTVRCSVIDPENRRYRDYAGKRGHRRGGEPFARAGRG